MRIIFAGSPEIAVAPLRTLLENHTVCAILTNPDRPSGRGGAVAETPVAEAARESGVPVLKPDRLGASFRAEIAAFGADLLVVVAYGRIFGPKFLSLFPKGAINLHPSLLPKYRGPSPIPAAILAGDPETGITVQSLALEMDSGDILAQKHIPLSGRETTGSLTELVAEEGAGLLDEVLRNFEAIEPVAQDPEGVSFCRLISKEDGIIDWSKSAVEIDRMVRAYTPWPEAQTTYDGVGLHILEAEPSDSVAYEGSQPGVVVGVDTQAGILVKTGSGTLVVKKLKLQSKKALSWKDFLNGARGFVGSVLGG